MTLNRVTILVVDDEPVLRLTFAMLLQQHGATVQVAADGAEALRLLHGTKFNVMLTDRHMPVMDGTELLRKVTAAGIRMPSILFVTGAEPADEDELTQLQVVRTASKPIHPEELLRLVGEVVEQYAPHP